MGVATNGLSLVALTKVTKAYYEWAFFIIYNGSMNYLDYLKNTFYLYSNDGKHVTCYLEDTNSIYEYEFVLPNNTYYYDYTAEELEYLVANTLNRQNDNALNTLDLIGFSIGSYEDMYYISTNKVDFYLFSCSNTSFDVSACRVNDGLPNANFDDYYLIDNYSLVTSNGVFNSGDNLGSFQKSLNNGQFTIFDYTNLHYANNDYTSDTIVIRGENVSFYNVYYYINNADGDNVYISYGSPLKSSYDRGYSTGYGAGYSNGYVTGQDIGFQNGVNSQGVTNQSATAFSYISQAFGAINNIMSLEVLPNINLGLCFSIPLVVVLIMTLFKLVRK